LRSDAGWLAVIGAPPSTNGMVYFITQTLSFQQSNNFVIIAAAQLVQE
jgi:hypothetical protein